MIYDLEAMQAASINARFRSIYPRAEFRVSFAGGGSFAHTIECRLSGRVGVATVDVTEDAQAGVEEEWERCLDAAAHRAWLAAGGRLPGRRFRFQVKNPKRLSTGEEKAK